LEYLLRNFAGVREDGELVPRKRGVRENIDYDVAVGAGHRDQMLCGGPVRRAVELRRASRTSAILASLPPFALKRRHHGRYVEAGTRPSVNPNWNTTPTRPETTRYGASPAPVTSR
jgi:hypothetical protein